MGAEKSGRARRKRLVNIGSTNMVLSPIEP
jgi:hypothetical protein